MGTLKKMFRINLFVLFVKKVFLLDLINLQLSKPKNLQMLPCLGKVLELSELQLEFFYIV